MALFENKKTELIKSPGKNMTYADFLLLSMKHVSAQGLNVGEMSDRLEVIAKLKDAKEGETIEFSDDQLPAIKECVVNMRWAVCEEDIKSFGEYVASL